MKKLLALTQSRSPLAVPFYFGVIAALAVGFWFSTTPGMAQGSSCTVCHKRRQSLTFACNSLDYRRHLDHGDTMGECPVTPTQNP